MMTKEQKVVVGRLTGSRVYLAGAIDCSPDKGREWRNDITPFLKNFGIHVINPLNKPINIGGEDDYSRKLRDDLRQTGNFDLLAQEMRQIRSIDLRLVDCSDFLIVNLDLDVTSCGTYEEIFWANRLKRPILIHCPQGKQQIPMWLFGTLPHQLFFHQWDYLKKYIQEIHLADDCYVETLGRWVFFDYSKM